ncbi:hypothetical protein BR93DRAFT_923809 [Coniochaeta sp. PMI_546]|nr:hypothetical protein BR93DRAFT_923809 [Coniochaeta sp. PMI_546]
MAAEVDQATAQEKIAPAQPTSDAPEPLKVPDEAEGIKPTEDKAPGDKATSDAEFPKADDPVTSNLPVGTAATGDKQEAVASKEEQAAPTESGKAEDAVADAAPVSTAVGGEKQEDAAPKEDPSTAAGALGDDAPAPAPATAPADLAAAPAAQEVKESATEEKPAEETLAAKTNGAEKDVEMTQPPAPEEKLDAAAAAVPTGEKRKAEEPAAANGDAKKAKSDANGTNGKAKAKKPGRPAKKDKKPLEKAKEAVGRTLRKTRSQGPIDQ